MRSKKFLTIIFVISTLLRVPENRATLRDKGSKMGFNKNIVELAQKNTFFRKELVTGKH